MSVILGWCGLMSKGKGLPSHRNEEVGRNTHTISGNSSHLIPPLSQMRHYQFKVVTKSFSGVSVSKQKLTSFIMTCI